MRTSTRVVRTRIVAHRGGTGRPPWSAVGAAIRQCWSAGPVLLLATVALNVVGGALPVATAVLTKRLLDALAHPPIRVPTLVLAGTVLCGAGTLAIQQVSVLCDQLLRRRINAQVQRTLFTKLNGFVGLRPFEDPATYEELTVAQQAGVSAPQQIAGAGLRIARSSVQMVGFGIAVWTLWPPILILVVVAAVPAILAETRLARAGSQLLRRVSQIQRRRFFYETMLTDPGVAQELRLFGANGFMLGKMLAALDSANRAETALDWRSSRARTLLGLLGQLVTAGGLVLAVVRVAHGALTVGDVVLLLAALAGVQSCLLSLVTDTAQSYESLLTYGSYRALLTAPPDLPTGRLPAPALRHGIEFRDVWFRYREDGPWILRGVSFTIRYGEGVGLVGQNGAGKSTLVKLLCRLYDPGRGQILWDGVDIRAFDPVTLRTRLGAVFQDFVRYDLTGRENIAIGSLASLADADRIRHAARLAEAESFLTALPDGFDTMLSRIFFADESNSSGTGVTLSGGQWQRVALARSLLRDAADLLILDEPSSGLDAIAEHRIHTTLRAHRHGRTSLLISHRLGTIKDADAIVVLDQGRVVEYGTHAQLIAEDGGYAQMYNQQAEGYRLAESSP